MASASIRRKCIVRNCPGGDSKDISLFRFPQKKTTLDVWLHNLKIDSSEINDKSRICNRHFEPLCCGDRRLKSFAVPTQLLGEESNELLPPELPNKRVRQRACHIPDCTSLSPPCKLFSFPKDHALRKRWIIRCGLEEQAQDNADLLICAKHFPADQVFKSRLARYALPFRVYRDKDGNSCVEEEEQGPCSQCVKSAVQVKHYEEKCRKYEKDIETLKQSRKRLKDDHTVHVERLNNEIALWKQRIEERTKNGILISDECSVESQLFIRMIASNMRRTYTEAEKTVLLGIHKISPRAYSYLRDDLRFSLPTSSTLSRFSTQRREPNDETEHDPANAAKRPKPIE